MEEIRKRLYRVETLIWILVGINGLNGAKDLIPLVSAMLGG